MTKLTTGTRLGPYEIIAPIGSGGMGEVFRAKDTRLDRTVAIKVLSSHLSSNPQLRERFDREARAISQLNHPNICTLHDVGHENGTDYLVMELLEGTSLADRLAKGPLPLPEVLRYGAEIAGALDRAHKAGIIHRDLKPGNVMLTRSGAKLLDFGLAKSVPDISAVSGATNMATEQKPLTQEGTILGTFQYMAPEQLEGEEADARTDIFALGALLYEMATGKRAFEGKTRTSLIAAIVSSEPRPIGEIQPLTPPALEHLIKKCLAKERDDRWQSAHDIAEELKWIGETGSQAGVAAPLIARRKSRERLAWLLNLATAIGAAVLTWMFIQFRTPPPRVIESSILPPAKLQFSFQDGPMALSPDGSRIAFPASDGKGAALLFIRPLDSNTARQLSGTEGALYPFWSPDGSQLGFFADGKLKTIDASGGPPQTLCDAQGARGATWSSRDTILFTPGARDPIYGVSASGGSARPVTKLNGATSHRFPHFLPDGNHFLFLATAPPGKSAIYVGSSDGTDTKLVLSQQGVSAAEYANGHLIFWRSGTLMAQRFDLKGFALIGNAVSLGENIAVSGPSGPLFSVSTTGELAYQRGFALRQTQLVWVDRQGKEIAALAPPALFFSPRISHDGRRVAVDISAAGTGFGDIWMFDQVRKVSSRLTYNPANESGPTWSSDDRDIFFFSERGGPPNLFRIPSSGTGQEETILENTAMKLPTDISRDGQWLLFNSNAFKGALMDLWLYSISERKARPWLATPFSESSAQFSPDGKWIIYQSDESGKQEIYVRSFPDSREKWLVSAGGGTMPSWRKDGRELYYISPEQKMMAVAVKLTPSFETGTPVPLFEVHVLPHPSLKQYDVSADGTRFLLNRVAREEESEPITLVQNWPVKLKKR